MLGMYWYRALKVLSILNINLHILFLVLKILAMVLVSVGKAGKREIVRLHFLSLNSYRHVEFVSIKLMYFSTLFRGFKISNIYNQ